MSSVVERARTLVGSSFRFQGRTAKSGLDCVGLAALVYRLPVHEVPLAYDWRGSTIEDVLGVARGRFGVIKNDKWMPGDLLVAHAGRGRLHLAVWTGAGIIHADAARRYVCERPGFPPMRVGLCLRPNQEF